MGLGTAAARAAGFGALRVCAPPSAPCRPGPAGGAARGERGAVPRAGLSPSRNGLSWRRRRAVTRAFARWARGAGRRVLGCRRGTVARWVPPASLRVGICFVPRPVPAVGVAFKRTADERAPGCRQGARKVREWVSALQSRRTERALRRRRDAAVQPHEASSERA